MGEGTDSKGSVTLLGGRLRLEQLRVLFPRRRRDARSGKSILNMFLLLHADKRGGDAGRRADELQGALCVAFQAGEGFSDDRRQIAAELALQD